MGYENAIKAVMDGSYRTKSEDDLCELLKECMDLHGSNPVALHRATHAAEILHRELSSRFLSGKATWLALQSAVKEIASRVPENHDVLIQVGEVAVTGARFIEPHTFLFEGKNQNDEVTRVIVHFSKLDARVVYRPKRGPSRIITGFHDSL